MELHRKNIVFSTLTFLLGAVGHIIARNLKTCTGSNLIAYIRILRVCAMDTMEWLIVNGIMAIKIQDKQPFHILDSNYSRKHLAPLIFKTFGNWIPPT